MSGALHVLRKAHEVYFKRYSNSTCYQIEKLLLVNLQTGGEAWRNQLMRQGLAALRIELCV